MSMNELPRIAFIGGGNMATAIIQGLITSGAQPDRILVAEPLKQKRQELTNQFGVLPFPDASTAVCDAGVVILAVKPAIVETVLSQIADTLLPNAVVISIAAGVTIDAMMSLLSASQPVVRVMPNTPALVAAGMSVLCPAPHTTDAQLALATRILDAVGQTATVRDESLLDAVTGLSGSGPAYVFLIAEALSDAGVSCGLPRPLADQLAIQTLLGSSQLMSQTGEHPAVLKSQVTSPGGTTIAGVMTLEQSGVRGALMQAVQAAWKRSQELGAR
ncbi:pyrroline-5-carboxylate reductase [Magnetofaba australis]|uniref:Pyrroline-5-carboxylate reductase n=1 Tax=Magnetofaba australis IT-1 TaxID=1434232 RepID=A0A1Y2K018_9PROT|nr:pyrroline-5-carboxylate reductase [Magnetofaba australis]OSM00456.1 putative pyrroline-5-carboxylate reductase [Magnetofaba australis IT-1]